MAQTELILPKMGESVAEATIIKWLKAEGDVITTDESIVEIATDKVDTEIPAPTSGVLAKILFQEGETVSVGTPIAIITDEGEEIKTVPPATQKSITEVRNTETLTQNEQTIEIPQQSPEPALELSPTPDSGLASDQSLASSNSKIPRFHKGRFFSPLVRKIAHEEGVSNEDLQKITGNGQNGRVTKKRYNIFS